MLTSKQRSFLKKSATDLADTVHIGKDGLTENIIKQVEEQLTVRELIKGKIQSNSLEDVRTVAQQIADKTDAQVVLTIGKKFILFRQADKDSKYVLPV